MITRRSFFQTFPAAIALPRLLTGAQAPLKERISIGAQTNTWGVPIAPYEHFLEVVDTIAKIGYDGFETNFNSLKARADQPAECRKDFESRHTRLIAAHTGARLYDKEKLQAEVDNLQKIAVSTAPMGAAFLIVSGQRLPHTGASLDQNAAHIKMEALNNIGRMCKQEGLQLCYHNHFQEFQDTPSEMSLFLKETDPGLVMLNYDVGNAEGVGPDPGAFSAEHFRRIRIYHIKDVKPATPGHPTPVDLGQGVIDLKAVVKPVLNSDWKGWLIVEREGSYPKSAEHPENLVRQCREYLKQITGV